MQRGSLKPSPRRHGPDVWEYRWRETGPDGTRVHRRMVVRSAEEFPDQAAAAEALAGLMKQINAGDPRVANRLTLDDLVKHFRQRELDPATTSKSFSTRRGYEGYLKRWILPRWGSYLLHEIQPIEVESWLRQQKLAAPSSGKIRDILRLLYNHACRHGLYDCNPIYWVRAQKTRKKIPEILTPQEAGKLLNALDLRERVLTLIAIGAGLRKSELFALKWMDIAFEQGQIHVMRSIVYQVVGLCKTENSRKPVPMHPFMAKALMEWRAQVDYTKPEDWVFASSAKRGKQPYWGSAIMRCNIQTAARKVGIEKRIGWHTFRHTYASWLKLLGTDVKVMQVLMRHSSLRTTLDIYTEAMTAAKRAAQNGVMSLLFGGGDEDQLTLVKHLTEDLKMMQEMMCQTATRLTMLSQTLPAASVHTGCDLVDLKPIS